LGESLSGDSAGTAAGFGAGWTGFGAAAGSVLGGKVKGPLVPQAASTKAAKIIEIQRISRIPVKPES
jgi:hypothetical protein